MPKRATHRLAGGCAGVGAVIWYRSRGDGQVSLAEILGGLAGGSLAGALPDRLDPPLSPNHRALAHGFLPAVALAMATAGPAIQASDSLLQEAAKHGQMRNETKNGLQAVWHFCLEQACRFLSG